MDWIILPPKSKHSHTVELPTRIEPQDEVFINGKIEIIIKATKKEKNE